MAETKHAGAAMRFHRYSRTPGKSGWWWAASCRCGWMGPDRRTAEEAELDWLDHDDAARAGGPRAALRGFHPE